MAKATSNSFLCSTKKMSVFPNGERLKEKVRHLPQSSGVYIMKDSLANVIYIGKAANLRKRVAQYFQSSRKSEGPKRDALKNSIADFEYRETKNEAEALILESKLIKQWRPYYNTLEKDDKNFLYLRVERFAPLPRFTYVRHRNDDNSLYFGPYLNPTALRRALNEIKKDFGILLSDAHPKKLPDGRWQLYNDARSEISKFENVVHQEEYLKRVSQALEFLRGKNAELAKNIQEKMLVASQNQDYESAAKYRDILFAMTETSKANARAKVHADISKQPEEIAKIAMQRLGEILKTQTPNSMECFDISHISGTFVVASMVRFENGVPAKSKYRKFEIKENVANNDYTSMHEVVQRRYKRLAKEGARLPDLIVIDGGKGQIFSALKAFDEAGLTPPKMIGLAEREETIVLEDFTEILLPRSDEGLKLLQRIRDEAHRFANEYRKQLQRRKIRESILDDCAELGKKRKEALLKHFGSIAKIKNATIEQLRQVEGIGFETALALRNFLDANFPSSIKK